MSRPVQFARRLAGVGQHRLGVGRRPKVSQAPAQHAGQLHAGQLFSACHSSHRLTVVADHRDRKDRTDASGGRLLTTVPRRRDSCERPPLVGVQPRLHARSSARRRCRGSGPILPIAVIGDDGEGCELWQAPGTVARRATGRPCCAGAWLTFGRRPTPSRCWPTPARRRAN